MNKVILVGRLTRDPEVRYSQGEKPVAIARFTLAVDRRYRRDNDDQSADFINCVAFGKDGEWFEKYVRQGTKISISGRIQTGSYTNRDGQKVYTTDVVVEEREFAERKDSGAGNAAPAGNNNANNDASRGFSTDNDGFMSIPDGIDDEGLPFN